MTIKPEWLTQASLPLQLQLRDQALAYQDQLTKPQGSLGQLERKTGRHVVRY